MADLFVSRERMPLPLPLALLLVLVACTGPAAADEQPDRPATPADADQADQAGNAAEDIDDRALLAGDTPPFAQRLDAPPLDGGIEWINAAGPIHMKDLRGKFVVLDFWTYCCINCIHILPELKKLEHAYPNSIVVIGVHSAKFDQEKDSKNIRKAVLRYDIEHPVVNDANFAIWRRYGVSGWPGLRIIDPEGYLVAGHGGEIEFETLDRFFKEKMPYYRKQGLLDETPMHFALERSRREPTPLKFPGKVLADADSNRMFIADTGHSRIVVAQLDGKLLDVIGDGTPGRADGDYATARFDNPQGMALVGNTLYVADTQNHLIRKIDLEKKQVTTIAGTGEKGQGVWPGMEKIEFNPQGEPKLPERWVGEPLKTAIASPWALLVREDVMYIAMAGPHQIWSMKLDGSEIGPFAGNGIEDIADGRLLPKIPPRWLGMRAQPGYSSFAQPSGLAADDRWLYVADSEGSAIRAVPFDPTEKVFTVVGQHDLARAQALFSFGDVDGKGDEVRLQHVLGVVHSEGKLYIADTYNNKIKRIDLEKRTASTVSGTGASGLQNAPAQFDEPSGLSLAGNLIYVADTNNHAIRTLDRTNDYAAATLTIEGLVPPAPPTAAPGDPFAGAVRVELEPIRVKPIDGNIRLVMQLELPEGYKINELGPAKYRVESQSENGVVDAAALGEMVRPEKKSAVYELTLPVKAATGRDQLQISQTYFYCREGGEGFCKVGNVTWLAPIELSDQAEEKPIQLRHLVEE